MTESILSAIASYAIGRRVELTGITPLRPIINAPNYSAEIHDAIVRYLNKEKTPEITLLKKWLEGIDNG